MTINTQKFQQLRDHLERLIKLGRQDKFDMGEWLYDLEEGHPVHHLEESTNPECGTAGCLAGHVIIMDQAMEVDTTEYAQTTLGLDEHEARYMFMGKWARNDLSQISIEETIEYLGGVILVGTVYVHEEDDPNYGDDEDEEAWQTCDDNDLIEEESRD